ncbi:MAG: hypothetical protein FOGNACKC_00307 [Anaerolineae bacterium]|nr:hypothetical protein [Anaerolineae bacterium]
MTPQHRVDFEPLGRRGPCAEDQSLLESARQLGVELINDCGGSGVCGHCKVRVISGQLWPALTLAEEALLLPAEIEQGCRLACMAYPRSACKLHVPAESLSQPMQAQTEGLESRLPPDPVVQPVAVELAPPSLAAPLADADNLLQAINRAGPHPASRIDFALLQTLSPQLRQEKWRGVAYLRQQEVIAFAPAGTPVFGLAIDLGSTGIAAYLVDLLSGDTLAARGVMNPQISYGEDVVSRVTYALKSPAARQTMQRVVLETLNQVVDDLCRAVGGERRQILEAVIVGNTVMHHLLLGLPTRQLVTAPFTPAVNHAIDLKARELGLPLAPGASIHLPPNIAGFIGADHVAMLLAVGAEPEQPTLAIDIGTNTEISLLSPGRPAISVSCASGPAFEGYHIRHGVRARAGAIEKVQILAAGVLCQTIGQAPPNGICGSGILDVVAQLHLAGAVSDNGRLEIGAHPGVRQGEQAREFVLVEADPTRELKEIVVTQNDIREILLAKSAIQTGIQALLAESSLTPADIGAVVIAGAFGSYINVANAVAIGLLPPVPLARIQQVGNAAGIGAKYLLLSNQKRAQAEYIRTGTRYLELARYPNFSRLFAQNCRLTAGYG